MAKLSEEELNEQNLIDDEEEGAEGKQIQSKLVLGFIRMWPRGIFHDTAEVDGTGRKRVIADTIPELKKIGVYVLYRGDQPFYVGKTKKSFASRLAQHAQKFSTHSFFWDRFSAFIVEDESNIDEVEALVIAAMPAVITNSAQPRLRRIPLPEKVKEIFKKMRETHQF